MAYVQEDRDVEIDRLIESLKQLRQFAGPPNQFWPAFLEVSARLAGARLGLLLVQGEDGGSWRKLCVWPTKGRGVPQSAGLAQKIEEVAEASAAKRCAWDSMGPTGDEGANEMVLGVRLDLDEADRKSVAVFFLDNGSTAGVGEVATRLKLAADTPLLYQIRRAARQARNDVIQFSEAMDLMVLLNAEKRYMAAAMTFCNEVASRYQCTRASLGWLEGGYVRLQAISHMERFEKKMDVVQLLEAAMEEGFDQNEEIVWPQPEGSATVVRDHEAFSREQGTQYMVSIPIRLEDAPVGILTCERGGEPFSEEEVRGLRVQCDQAARRLGDLKQNDRWFGAKTAMALRTGLSRLFGVEHTFAKGVGVLVCVALAFLLFGKLTYRVEAPFIIKSDDVKYIPAPFDGYIDKVHAEVGDRVDKEALLLTLDRRELLLEESTVIANQNQYMREAQKARVQNALADMKIALAQAAQAKARLDLVRYHLRHAEVSAPFAGIVVEGDLEELLGSPVKKGDVLFKVALIERMYAELEVDERDIHELTVGASGEMAFVSQPKLKFPIKVERIDPVAIAKEEGNVFLVRCLFSGEVDDWWRPGMSGVSKINVGKRNVLWIVTHRTIDFFRMLLWW